MMNFSIAVICLKDDGTEARHDVLTVTKDQLVMETLGLTVAEGKALLASLQAAVVDEQAATYLKQHRACETCGTPHRGKDPRQSTVNTVFGPIAVPNPRWHRCVCQNTGSRTFRPTAQWLTGQTSPELLYLESKWGSLIPYAKVAELLTDVLPVAQTMRAETVRRHVHATANRLE